jgi:hypothetical protein
LPAILPGSAYKNKGLLVEITHTGSLRKCSRGPNLSGAFGDSVLQLIRSTNAGKRAAVLALGELWSAAVGCGAHLSETPLCIKCGPMTKLRDRLSRLSVAAASVVLLSAGPGFGQRLPIPCSAFSRHADGWKVLAPVVLDIDGRLLAPTVGTIFTAGSATNGVKLNEMLDHECGEQVTRPARWAGTDLRRVEIRRTRIPPIITP